MDTTDETKVDQTEGDHAPRANDVPHRSSRVVTIVAALALSAAVGGGAALLVGANESTTAPDATESVTVEDGADDASTPPADTSASTSDDSPSATESPDTESESSSGTGDEGPAIERQPFDPGGIDPDPEVEGGFDIEHPTG
ncbi:MAG: hypothetical protein WEA75_01125 [Acidimicrobiia bacterium]